MSSKDTPNKEQDDTSEQSQSTAEASRARHERRKQKRAEFEKMWGTTLEAATYLGVSESTVSDLLIRRTHPRDKHGRSMRTWVYYWPDVLELSDKWLKEATRYQKRLGLD